MIVGGFLGLLPAGGVTWDYVQYPVGFAELGCDVYYVEDTRLWPVFQSESQDRVDCTANVRYLAEVMKAFGLAERWAYRDEVSGACFGLSEGNLQEICRSADIFVNVSCSTFLRDDYLSIPVRALIDSDPMFTQIQCVSRARLTKDSTGTRDLLSSHTHHFTFGENFGAEDCRIPSCDVDWLVTRQPVCLRHWASEPAHRAGNMYTTVMNWSAAPPLRFDGEMWGQKDVEFLRFLDLPHEVENIPVAVAVGQTTGGAFPSALAEERGWSVLDAAHTVPDWRSYRSFIEASRGEFSTAKETYVKARTGWFSCRSACYLAAGRPVVTQDTGWSRHLPNGTGLLAFGDLEGAAAALTRVEADWPRHAKAAREIAADCFDSRFVLSTMLEDLARSARR